MGVATPKSWLGELTSNLLLLRDGVLGVMAETGTLTAIVLLL